MKENTKKSIGILLLILCMAAVLYPRFDRQDIGPIKRLSGHVNGRLSLGDAPYYSGYVEYFRGYPNTALNKIEVPFRFRFVGPLIASFLPFRNSMTAVNVLNALALFVSLWFLFLLLKSLNFEFRYSLLGCFLFTISFPVFYFGSDGTIDAQVICLMTAATYIIFKGKWWYLIPILAIGAGVKETIIIMAPVAAAYYWIRNEPWKIRFLVLILVYVASYALIRILLAQGSTYVWRPTLANLLVNIRPRTIIGLALAFGLPGLLALLYGLKFKVLTSSLPFEKLFPLATGLLFSILLLAYSMWAAYADGRFLWPSNIFTVPIAVAYLREIRNRRVLAPAG
jgi:hypothetical protein